MYYKINDNDFYKYTFSYYPVGEVFFLMGLKQ